MSRIGKTPVALPSGVEVDVKGRHISVSGPKGRLERALPSEIAIERGDGVLTFTRSNEEREVRALHGLTRSLVANMVQGVTEGYTKRLEIVGVGYRVAARGSDLEFSLGYSHPVLYRAPEGISFA